MAPMAARLQNWWYRNIWEPRAGEKIYGIKGQPAPPAQWSLNDLFGITSSSGRPVSYDSSITLSAVWRAMTIKSGILGSMPFKVYKKTNKGRIQINPSDHPVARMMAGKLNPKQTKHIFFERSMQHLEGWGNHIGLISFAGVGLAERIDLIHPKDVECFDGKNRMVYKIKGETVDPHRIIHVPNMGDGPWGKSTVVKGGEDMSMQMDLRDYETGVNSKGGIPIGLFMPKDGVRSVTNQQRAELIESWNKAKMRSKAVAMPAGWEWIQMSLAPEALQMIQSKEFGILDVARWFGVPPQKLYELGRATYNNVEHMGIEFLQDTMSPLASKYEGVYTSALFRLPSEEDLYLEFNMDAYLRADAVSKAEALTRMVAGALRTPNEARKLDNYEAKEGGDDLFIQSATVPITMLKQLLLSKSPSQQRAMIKKIETQLSDGIDPQLILEGLFKTNQNGKH